MNSAVYDNLEPLMFNSSWQMQNFRNKNCILNVISEAKVVFKIGKMTVNQVKNPMDWKQLVWFWEINKTDEYRDVHASAQATKLWTGSLSVSLNNTDLRLVVSWSPPVGHVNLSESAAPKLNLDGWHIHMLSTRKWNAVPSEPNVRALLCVILRS